MVGFRWEMGCVLVCCAVVVWLFCGGCSIANRIRSEQRLPKPRFAFAVAKRIKSCTCICTLTLPLAAQSRFSANKTRFVAAVPNFLTRTRMLRSWFDRFGRAGRDRSNETHTHTTMASSSSSNTHYSPESSVSASGTLLSVDAGAEVDSQLSLEVE